MKIPSAAIVLVLLSLTAHAINPWEVNWKPTNEVIVLLEVQSNGPNGESLRKDLSQRLEKNYKIKIKVKQEWSEVANSDYFNIRILMVENFSGNYASVVVTEMQQEIFSHILCKHEFFNDYDLDSLKTRIMDLFHSSVLDPIYKREQYFQSLEIPATNLPTSGNHIGSGSGS